jgi:hypothetical protein
LPPDDELVDSFRTHGAHVHLYECHLDGDSDEIVLFEHAPQAA